MILLSAQGMPAAKIAEVTFASPDRVRDVIHNFNADGLSPVLRRPSAEVHAAGTAGDQSSGATSTLPTSACTASSSGPTPPDPVGPATRPATQDHAGERRSIVGRIPP